MSLGPTNGGGWINAETMALRSLLPSQTNERDQDMALRPVVPSETNEGRRRVGPAVHDRFIPRRRHDTSAFHMSADGCTLNASPAKEEYKRLLAKELCGSPISRVLAFGPSTTASEEPELCIHRQHRHLPSPHARWVPQLPERILDAPDLVDDYYLNLLDWRYAAASALPWASASALPPCFSSRVSR